MNAFHGRVNAWEIWNEEDTSGWWTGIAGAVRRAAEGRLPGDQVGRPQGDRDHRRPDRQRRRLPHPALRRRRPGSFDAVGVHTDTGCNITSPYVFEFDRGTQTINQYFFLGFISIHGAMVAAGDAAQADLHDRARLVLDQRRVRDGRVGRARSSPASRRRRRRPTSSRPTTASPSRSTPTSRRRCGSSSSTTATSSAPLDNFGLLNARLLAQAGVRRLRGGIAARRPAERPLRRLHAAGDHRSCTPTSGQHAAGALHIAVSASDPSAGIHEITDLPLGPQPRALRQQALPGDLLRHADLAGREAPARPVRTRSASSRSTRWATGRRPTVTFVHGDPARRAPHAAAARRPLSATAARCARRPAARRAADYRAGVRGGVDDRRRASGRAPAGWARWPRLSCAR